MTSDALQAEDPTRAMTCPVCRHYLRPTTKIKITPDPAFTPPPDLTKVDATAGRCPSCATLVVIFTKDQDVPIAELENLQLAIRARLANATQTQDQSSLARNIDEEHPGHGQAGNRQ